MPLFLIVLGPALPFYPTPCMFRKFLPLSGCSEVFADPVKQKRSLPSLCRP